MPEKDKKVILKEIEINFEKFWSKNAELVVDKETAFLVYANGFLDGSIETHKKIVGKAT